LAFARGDPHAGAPPVAECFFFQAEDGIRDFHVTGVQTCALPILPEFVTRNTLYYSSHFFKKALFLQTGVTFNYFTKYYMNAYDPLMAEFYVQTDREFGGYPRFDFFVNAKIQRARIYIKAEHFNAAWTGYNYYSAPNHPYRDFAIRVGLVWNFFL